MYNYYIFLVTIIKIIFYVFLYINDKNKRQMNLNNKSKFKKILQKNMRKLKKTLKNVMYILKNRHRTVGIFS